MNTQLTIDLPSQLPHHNAQDGSGCVKIKNAGLETPDISATDKSHVVYSVAWGQRYDLHITAPIKCTLPD